ncbi:MULTISPECIES: SDR family NAD(P)-dependent oxidoreductase [unclassified Micromonospora]|uniref:SDR family NAD(P)-dependent oxidoreductase n=1 Tax=unclassified Micromonospora TaxID=2617518 RepID=UPI0018909F1D|nr:MULTISPECIES: SDR family NAD(P)-dependent oxidoreductase [unclassified Micromonospora]MBF5030956.1 SDR family NAD(P)-dependent oxidoreductase [Micromonospora sp. ANENR4]MCZ7474324.1 SDR family NAD(P)-dependent oxidoreductase [Micromonospora sp. WMMC273]WBC04975.1 SDR family NAD(P)-dependent oxidoreductase [Micromonospora sp. WMMA1976]
MTTHSYGDPVVVTGAGGFIGSHLVEALVGAGHRVRAFVHYNGAGTHGWLDALGEDQRAGVDVVAGDIRDRGMVQRLVDGASVVYHLAALGGIPYSYLAPQSYVETNITGTLNVLESARTASVGRVVVTSTSEVYGTATTVPMTEEHRLRGQSPYSASKIGADKLAESYHLSFGLPVVTLRPFNTYGPRQSTRAVIPTIISQLAKDEGKVRLGALGTTRDLLYVTDTVAAFQAVGTAADDAVVGGVFQAATGRETSIGDLVRKISAIFGVQPELIVSDSRLRPPESEVERLVGDPGLLRARTGWQPTKDIDDGLKATVEWFLDPANLARYRSDRAV